MQLEKHSHKKYLLPIVFLLVIVVALSSLGAVQSMNLNKTQDMLTATKTELTTTKDSLTQTQTLLATTKDSLTLTQTQLATTRDNLNQTQTRLTSVLNSLAQTQSGLAKTQSDLATTRNQLSADEAKLMVSLQPPYTAISARQVTWAWRGTKGNLIKWTMPVDTYRAWIQVPEPSKLLTLTVNNRNYSVLDYRPLVVSTSFSTVVPSLASQYPDGISFAKEMFNLVTQLDVYATEELPHWPLETLTEAGGDCKNLSILYASLLKAAPFPYKLQFIYVDSDNPSNPITINHVFVGVTLGATTVYVDCTNKDSWGYWNSKPFKGWFFDL